MIGLPNCRPPGMPISICCKNLYHILPSHRPCLRAADYVSEIRSCHNADIVDIVSSSDNTIGRVPDKYTTDSIIDVVLNNTVFRCKFNEPACVAHINQHRTNILPPCPHTE